MKYVLFLSFALALAAHATAAETNSSVLNSSEIADIKQNIVSCWSVDELKKLKDGTMQVSIKFDEAGNYSGVSLVDHNAFISDPAYRVVGRSLIMSFRSCKHIKAPERFRGQKFETVLIMSLEDFLKASNVNSSVLTAVKPNVTPPSRQSYNIAIAQEPDPLRLYFCSGVMEYTIKAYKILNPGEVVPDKIAIYGFFALQAAEDILAKKGVPKPEIVQYRNSYIDAGKNKMLALMQAKINFVPEYQRCESDISAAYNYLKKL